MSKVHGAEDLRNDVSGEAEAASRPASSLMLESVTNIAEGVARCLDAWRIAQLSANLRSTRRITTKIADSRHIFVMEKFALASAVLCRRAFAGDEAPLMRTIEAFVERVASFAWAAGERLRELSFARDLKLGPRTRHTTWNEGETERQMHNVLLHIEAEAKEAFEVDELTHDLPTTNADVWRRLLEASKRYQNLRDGSVNEAAPWLMFVEFAVSRRKRLIEGDDRPSFVGGLDAFTRSIDGLPRTEHLNIARALINTFGEVAGDYSKSDRNITNKARQAARQKEKGRVK